MRQPLEQCQEDWEHLAALDPLWAILAFRRKKFGRWGHDEFFATGEEQVAVLMGKLGALGRPRGRGPMLDFGCGVGRLARGFTTRFDSYCGVDISQAMVAQARQLHRDEPRCSFLVNVDIDLAMFADRSFDLVFSYHALQHLKERATIESYLRSFVRVLDDEGLLVLQLPGAIPRPEKALSDARDGLYRRLRRVGLPDRILFRRMGLFPAVMNFLPEPDVVAVLEGEGARILEVESARIGVAMSDRTYYVSRS